MIEILTMEGSQKYALHKECQQKKFVYVQPIIVKKRQKEFLTLYFKQIDTQIEPIKWDFDINYFKSICHCIDTNSEFDF